MNLTEETPRVSKYSTTSAIPINHKSYFGRENSSELEVAGGFLKMKTTVLLPNKYYCFNPTFYARQTSVEFNGSFYESGNFCNLSQKCNLDIWLQNMNLSIWENKLGKQRVLGMMFKMMMTKVMNVLVLGLFPNPNQTNWSSKTKWRESSNEHSHWTFKRRSLMTLKSYR